MPLYEMTSTVFCTIIKKSFVDINFGERTDIQRLLRTQIAVLDDELYTLTERVGS